MESINIYRQTTYKKTQEKKTHNQV